MIYLICSKKDSEINGKYAKNFLERVNLFSYRHNHTNTPLHSYTHTHTPSHTQTHTHTQTHKHTQTSFHFCSLI